MVYCFWAYCTFNGEKENSKILFQKQSFNSGYLDYVFQVSLLNSENYILSKKKKNPPIVINCYQYVLRML